MGFIIIYIQLQIFWNNGVAEGIWNPGPTSGITNLISIKKFYINFLNVII